MSRRYRATLVIAIALALSGTPTFLGWASAGASSNSDADSAAKALITRILSDLARQEVDFGPSIFPGMYVTLSSLSESDKTLAADKNLSLQGTGSNYTISVKSASGTTFVVHGKVQKLSLSCAPAGVDCPGGTWAGPKTLMAPKIPVVTAAQKALVRQILTVSVIHYKQVLALGQKALGTTQYANGTLGLEAMKNPNSAAARFRDFRAKWNPSDDVSFIAAFKKADRNYVAGNEPPSISSWRNEMSNVSFDLSNWVSVAVAWQIRSRSTAQLNAALRVFEADLAKASAAINLVVVGK